MKAFPEFETERLRLRFLAVEDAADVLAIYDEEAVTKFSEMATLTTLEQAQRVIGLFQNEYSHGASVRWAMAEKSSGRVVGTCGLGWHPPNSSALMSYDVAREFWNRGFATEALRSVAAHCFTTTDTNRISATTTLDNGASMRVLQKLGFTEEGVLRDWGFWKGKFVDLRCFGLLRRDAKT